MSAAPPNEPRVRFPVKCPTCHTESIESFPIAVVAAALIRSRTIRLYANCHGTYWDASKVEVEQIREYLGSLWIDSNRGATEV